MKKEFNLSERRRIFKEGEEIWTDGTNEILLVEDVKEFIKLLKEEIKNRADDIHINAGYGDGCGYFDRVIFEIIDKLAGGL